METRGEPRNRRLSLMKNFSWRRLLLLALPIIFILAIERNVEFSILHARGRKWIRDALIDELFKSRIVTATSHGPILDDSHYIDPDCS